MRNLRWAADHAVDPSPARAALGVAELEALGDSALIDPQQRGFVDAALSVVIDLPEQD